MTAPDTNAVHWATGGLELALMCDLRVAARSAVFGVHCRRADRASALAQWDWPLDQALRREGAGGWGALQADGIVGAARFAAGAGRHGLPAD